MSDLDNLLDATLDDIADLPSFAPFSAGAHRVSASFGTKEIGGKTAITLDFKMIETLELANPQDPMPKAGDESNTMFIISNEYGLGNFKKCAAPFAAAMGFKNNREIVEGVKDVECILVSTIRVDKNDPDKQYLSVKELSVI